MGQYYQIVNPKKRQFLNPHKFGEGIKLLEFGSGAMGTMAGLAILLANSNNRGGGDLHSDDPIIGSWAGDPIVIAGDYASKEDPAEDSVKPSDEKKWRKAYVEENSKEPDSRTPTLYSLCSYGVYEDISLKVIRALCADSYYEEEFKKAHCWDSDRRETSVYDVAFSDPEYVKEKEQESKGLMETLDDVQRQTARETK